MKKKADDDEPEPEPEDETDSKKKKDPDSIDEIRAQLAVTGPAKSLIAAACAAGVRAGHVRVTRLTKRDKRCVCTVLDFWVRTGPREAVCQPDCAEGGCA